MKTENLHLRIKFLEDLNMPKLNELSSKNQKFLKCSKLADMQKLFESEDDSPNINISAEDYNSERTVLMTTIENENLSEEERRAIVTWLLSKEADVNQGDGYETPLMLAAPIEHLEIAKILLEAGADVNDKDDDGYSTLARAILENNFELAELIVEKNYIFEKNTNPIVTAVDEFIDEKLTKEETKNFIELFIKKGADINMPAGDEGHTPLMWAVEAASLEMVELLLVLGADVNKANLYQQTPLLLAASNGGIFTTEKQRERNLFSKITEILLQHGADVNATDGSNFDALKSNFKFNDNKNEARDRETILNLLLDHGAGFQPSDSESDEDSEEPPMKRAKIHEDSESDENSFSTLNPLKSAGMFQPASSPQPEEEEKFAQEPRSRG